MGYIVSAYYGSGEEALKEGRNLARANPKMAKYLRRTGPAVHIRTDDLKKVDELKSFFEKYSDPLDIGVMEELEVEPKSISGRLLGQ